MVEEFRHAARRAIKAGADGVEIHGGTGYLIHQFLGVSSNYRTDDWGGAIERRARFAVEVARSVSAEIGAERTGIRLSPGAKHLRDRRGRGGRGSLSTSRRGARSSESGLPAHHPVRRGRRGARPAKALGAAPSSSTGPAGRERRSAPTSRAGWRTSRPMDSLSSQIPTSSAGCAKAPRSTTPTAPPSTGAGRRATSITHGFRIDPPNGYIVAIDGRGL